MEQKAKTTNETQTERMAVNRWGSANRDKRIFNRNNTQNHWHNADYGQEIALTAKKKLENHEQAQRQPAENKKK